MKKVCILTERFAPEEFLLNDLAQEWKARGYDIEVLTQVPSYPHDKIIGNYQNRFFQKTEELNGIPTYRFRTVLGYNTRVKRKVLNYLNFAFWTTLWSLFKGWKYDVYFVYQVGPLTMASAFVILRYLWRRKCTIWTQDLWPEAVFAYGFNKTPLREKMLNGFVRFIYAACDVVLVSCPGFVDVLSKRIKKTITFIPQWDIGGSELPPKEKSDKKIFMFTGNIGVPQIVDQVVSGFHAAKLENAELHLVGGGVNLEPLKKMVAEKKISNVVFYGRQPHEKMPEFLAMADVLLLPLSSEFSLTLPGKFPAYLKTGRPIMGVIEGEAESLIKNENLGLTASPSDVDDIALTFKKFYECLCNDPDRILAYRENCLALSRSKFSRTKSIDKLTELVVM